MLAYIVSAAAKRKASRVTGQRDADWFPKSVVDGPHPCIEALYARKLHFSYSATRWVSFQSCGAGHGRLKRTCLLRQHCLFQFDALDVCFFAFLDLVQRGRSLRLHLWSAMRCGRLFVEVGVRRSDTGNQPSTAIECQVLDRPFDKDRNPRSAPLPPDLS
jgi:hypothetical protein